jgi:protease I
MLLEEKKVIVLAEDLYEDMELWYPLLRLREAGANVVVAGPEAGKEYKSKHGYPVTADVAADSVNPAEVSALIIPGGYAPDRIRRYSSMLNLVKGVHECAGIIAFICHAGWVPISAGILKGRKVTSFFAIRDDMVNAGAQWMDEEVVCDGNLISSRTPADLPAFCRAIVDALLRQTNTTKKGF